jgi:hypothetical protein
MLIEIFSYWIFIWFLLYYFKFTKYNPLLILIIGYIITLGELLYLISNKTKRYNLIKFTIINIIIKLIPIILIYNTKISFKDLEISLYIILIYIMVMIIINVNPIEFYRKVLNTYIYDDNKYKSVFSNLYDYLFLTIIKK